MTMERSDIYKFRGNPVTVIGPDMKPGDPAPEFTAQPLEWKPFTALAGTQGKVRILTALPSLETSVCDRETRRFNEEAAALDKDIVILAISTDLPFTQNRWCGASGVEQVTVLSDHMDTDFGIKYGCLLKEVRILRRAVFVVDRAGKLVYAAYMPVMGDEPVYSEVIAAARAAL